MSYRIFYSWQSDLDPKENRFLIRDAVQDAIKKDYSDKYFFDEATRDIPGTPDIVDTIFHKLDNSAILVADVSIINSNDSGRKVPNPNVMIELGYFSSFLGWENVVLVFNSSLGKLEDLPFDLRNRRILTYSTESKSLKQVKTDLSNILGYNIKNMDPIALENKKIISRRYANESLVVNRIIHLRPEDWNTSVVIHLLRTLEVELERELFLIQSEIHFSVEEKLTLQFVMENWLPANLNFMRKFFAAMEQVIYGEIIDSVNSEDPIKIIDGIESFRILSKKYLKFEERVRQSDLPARCEKLKSNFVGGGRKMIDVIIKLQKIFTYLKDGGDDPGKLESKDIGFVDFKKITEDHAILSDYIEQQLDMNRQYPEE